MNRKFMPIFSQIHAYLFTIFRLPFHQNTPAFYRLVRYNKKTKRSAGTNSKMN